MDKEVKKTKRTFSKVYKKYASEEEFLRSIGLDPSEVIDAEEIL